jgi:DNA-directed RNA polymerase subunit L
MAKKKPTEPEEDLEEDIGDFEDEEIESLYPKVEKKNTTETKVEESDLAEQPTEMAEIELEEDFEGELEEKPEVLGYKYLGLELEKGTTENDYMLKIKGQSHGFCNLFVKILLNIEGVNLAAYKVTGLEPSKVIIRLEKNYKIKDILYKGIESLREQLNEVKELFLKIM